MVRKSSAAPLRTRREMLGRVVAAAALADAVVKGEEAANRAARRSAS
jgi:hypothetical protein